MGWRLRPSTLWVEVVRLSRGSLRGPTWTLMPLAEQKQWQAERKQWQAALTGGGHMRPLLLLQMQTQGRLLRSRRGPASARQSGRGAPTGRGRRRKQKGKLGKKP